MSDQTLRPTWEPIAWRRGDYPLERLTAPAPAQFASWLTLWIRLISIDPPVYVVVNNLNGRPDYLGRDGTLLPYPSDCTRNVPDQEIRWFKAQTEFRTFEEAAAVADAALVGPKADYAEWMRTFYPGVKARYEEKMASRRAQAEAEHKARIEAGKQRTKERRAAKRAAGGGA